MHIRHIAFTLPLSLSLFTMACQPNPQGGLPNAQLHTVISSNAAVQGHVQWPSSFSTQATVNDIQAQATVSLIYPSNHPTLANQTIATGLTTSTGAFIINPDSNFTPPANTIFVLEANKRVGGPGNPLLALRTYLRWTGSTWTSITGPTIQINALTTAITIMDHYDSSFAPSDTIASVSDGLPSQLGANNPTAIESVRDLVTLTLAQQKDPSHQIKRVGSEYLDANNFTAMHGKVFDDNNAPLDGVSITARSLNSSIPFEATTTTAGGTYSFNDVPLGAQIEIVASRSGFTTRRRVEVLSSNPYSDPYINKYDFGTDGSSGGSGSAANALSDKPEVISVTPGRNASGIDPKTSFVLKFSEPMDRNSVEDGFSVNVYQDRQLSIHNVNSQGTYTRLGGNGQNGNMPGSVIWDESDFTASWNSDDTEVTFTFTDEKLLPTDKYSGKVPDYSVTFYAGGVAKTLKDKSGILRNNNWFKLTDGDFEKYFKFAIRTDEVKPSVVTVIAASQEGGSLRGDAIKVRFSERMLVDTKAGDIGPSNTILNGDANMSPLNPNLYTVVVNPNGSNTVYNWGTLGINNVGGNVVFDADDLTRKTVILLPENTGQNIFNSSDVIKVTVSSNIVDPAGNTIESLNNEKTTTAG